MCFTKTFKTKKEALDFFNNPKIAQEDIPVYKELDRHNCSPCFNFLYEKGFHYTENSISKNIYKGIDCYFLDIDKGLHSFKTKKRFFSYLWEGKWVKFYIPKRTKYWENDNNEIVSTDLVWY